MDCVVCDSPSGNQIDADLLMLETPAAVGQRYGLDGHDVARHVFNCYEASVSAIVSESWQALVRFNADERHVLGRLMSAVREAGVARLPWRRRKDTVTMSTTRQPVYRNGADEHAARRAAEKARQDRDTRDYLAWVRAGKPPMSAARRRELGLPPAKATMAETRTVDPETRALMSLTPLGRASLADIDAGR